MSDFRDRKILLERVRISQSYTSRRSDNAVATDRLRERKPQHLVKSHEFTQILMFASHFNVSDVLQKSSLSDEDLLILGAERRLRSSLCFSCVSRVQSVNRAYFPVILIQRHTRNCSRDDQCQRTHVRQWQHA